MFARRKDSLRELVRRQHEEFMQYQQRRDEELRQRDTEFRRRDEEFRGLTEEVREFNRELLLRNEKVYKAVIAEVEEGRKQIQANTKAVLSVLDRLESAGGAAAA
jgi:sugar-specific transcriptional regulator TrmB